jgi:hypothetical protein
MRVVDYTDERGRKYSVKLPPGAPDSEAEKGIPIGPPDVVDALGLPEPMATEIHNKLFEHKIFTAKDAARNPQKLHSVIQSTFKLCTARMMEAFRNLNRDIE